MIKRVVLWANGMVMVFNQNGDQLPDYQGMLPDVQKKIVEVADENTLFQRGEWGKHVHTITKEEFEKVGA